MTSCFRRINLGLGELSYHYRLKPRFFSLCFTVNTLKSSMGAVRLCLLVMVIQRLLKNISRKFLLETLRISPFKSIQIAETVMPGFNSEFYSRDCNRVSLILIVFLTSILRTFVFCILYDYLHSGVTQRTYKSFGGSQCFVYKVIPLKQTHFPVQFLICKTKTKLKKVTWNCFITAKN